MSAPRISPGQAEEFAVAVRRELGVAPPQKTALRVIAPAALPEGAISLGVCDVGDHLGVDLGRLFDGRLLIQGVSGAGKSWTLRRLLEQTHGLVQQIVIDPEGEFVDLEAALGLTGIDAQALDLNGMARAAERVREHRLSVRLDLSQCERERQMQAFTAFSRALIDAPREHWAPALIAIDEAHVLAPFGGSDGQTFTRKSSAGAMADLMSRGRKRGLVGVLATQRLAKLAKNVSAEALNFLVGLNTLDLDIRRAAETIGWDARKAFDRLPMLSPGEFVAVGPAFTRSPAVAKIGAVRTRHTGSRPEIDAPPPICGEDAAQRLGLDELIGASRDAEETRASEGGLAVGARAVRAFLKDPRCGLAARAYDTLAALAPNGARVADLAAELGVAAEAIAEALALLSGVGMLEFSDVDGAHAVRLERSARR